MNSKKIIILIIITNTSLLISGQLAISELSKIGILKSKTLRLKVKGQPTLQHMVIKLIPNLDNITSCTTNSLDHYKKLLVKILDPIDKSLKFIKSTISERTAGLRFWGAVIGGVALGVATSAQITAGIALHKANENAKAIMNMKEAIKKSNQAISKLSDSVGKTVLAVSALQDQINTQIVPFVNQLSCDLINTKLGLSLNQYFSEISLVFGPNLREPALSTLSIQAISRSFNGDFESLLTNLGYNEEDLLDVLESNSIVGRIIGVDLSEFFIILQIEYPTITTVPEAFVQKMNLISYNVKGSEWMSVFPSALLIRGSLISSIDLSSCTETTNSAICSHDTSTPLSLELYNCAKGNLSQCARTRVISSHVPRYALSEGVIFANCLPIPCQCRQNGQLIIQDVGTTNTMIDESFCNEVFLDGIYITVGKRILNRTTYSENVTVGEQVTIDPINIGSELAEIKKDIKESQELLDQSEEILDKINLSFNSTFLMIFLIIIAVISAVWIPISILWLYYLTKGSNLLTRGRSSRRDTNSISTLSSLLPGM
ncbi:fusion protein [Parajeilongvirus brazilense]|nr:fusion protein [Diaemus bat paramyxovirus]